MIPLLTAKNITKFFGAVDLFTDISFSIGENEHIGLIGANGSGKSTLMKILAGIDPPDDGDVVPKKFSRLVYLPQDDVLPENISVREALFEMLSDDEQDDTSRMGEVHRIIGSAGFEDMEQNVDLLSGGWRKRLAITRSMIQLPDLLLLDEPTNHLDIEGILWLEQMISNARFAVLVVTHDREFLDTATTRMIEIGTYYPDGFLSIPGSYTKFVTDREAFLEQQQKMEAVLSNKVRRENEWLSRSPKARTTKAQYRVDEAHRLQSELKEVKGRNRQIKAAEIDFQATDRKTKKLVAAHSIRAEADGKQIFDNLSLMLSPGTRLGLVGPNGAGKTTLMQILAGSREPDAGKVEWADQLAMVYFDQKREALDPDITLKKALWPDGDTVVYRGRSLHIVTWAKKFLFDPDQLDQPVNRLSGGEKARVLIAKLMLRPADVLLLDEPTNDLDIPSLEILEESLLEFKGAVVLVTHDRSLLDRVTDRVVGIDGKGNSEIYADYRQWVKDVESKNAPVKKEAAPKPVKPKNTSTKLSYKLQRELDGMEAAIELAEEDLKEKSARVQDPEIATNPAELQEACSRLDAAQAKVDGLYARWEELEAMQES